MCASPRVGRRSFLATMAGGALPGAVDQVDGAWRRGGSGADTRRASVLGRAASWLWQQQSHDGAWRSRTYGLLRSGQAYTPFVLLALLDVPRRVCPRPSAAVGHALAFSRSRTNAQGVLGLFDPDLLEYPNYATAMALQCLVRAARRSDKERIARMTAYLVAQQYGPDVGFPSDHPAYGGWGMGGRRSPEAPGHMDLSYTRHVLQALREAGVDNEPMYARARAFLRVVQRHPAACARQPRPRAGATARQGRMYDGGFYFSPVVLAANKGGLVTDARSGVTVYGSYATATSDGVLALLAAGVSPDDERILAARRWLAHHPRLDEPEGVPADQPIAWADAIRFYHFAVRAEAYRALGWTGPWGAEIRAQLAARQRDDGSFVNEGAHLMKEDDPLLCTRLAVLALTHAGRGGGHALGSAASKNG